MSFDEPSTVVEFIVKIKVNLASAKDALEETLITMNAAERQRLTALAEIDNALNMLASDASDSDKQGWAHAYQLRLISDHTVIMEAFEQSLVRARDLRRSGAALLTSCQGVITLCTASIELAENLDVRIAAPIRHTRILAEELADEVFSPAQEHFKGVLTAIGESHKKFAFIFVTGSGSIEDITRGFQQLKEKLEALKLAAPLSPFDNQAMNVRTVLRIAERIVERLK